MEAQNSENVGSITKQEVLANFLTSLRAFKSREDLVRVENLKHALQKTYPDLEDEVTELFRRLEHFEDSLDRCEPDSEKRKVINNMKEKAMSEFATVASKRQSQPDLLEVVKGFRPNFKLKIPISKSNYFFNIAVCKRAQKSLKNEMCAQDEIKQLAISIYEDKEFKKMFMFAAKLQEESSNKFIFKQTTPVQPDEDDSDDTSDCDKNQKIRILTPTKYKNVNKEQQETEKTTFLRSNDLTISSEEDNVKLDRNFTIGTRKKKQIKKRPKIHKVNKKQEEPEKTTVWDSDDSTIPSEEDNVKLDPDFTIRTTKKKQGPRKKKGNTKKSPKKKGVTKI